MDLSILIINSVLRSHLDEVGESQSECHTAVLNRNGTFGITIRATPAGEMSMMKSERRIHKNENRMQKGISMCAGAV